MGFSSTLIKTAITVSNNLKSETAALVIQGEKKETIPVQFNPSEYRILEQTDFSEVARRRNNEPVVNFNGIPLSALNVKLYFDCDEITTVSQMLDNAASLFSDEPDKKNITDVINKISKLTYIDGKLHEPPTVSFVWGSLNFQGFATSVVTTYTMFDRKGKPLRATVDLTIKGVNANVAEQVSPYRSPDRTKARSMTEDSNIWQMAENEYGDVREWRRIADANDIMNPLDIPVGKVLKVPSIDEH